jgi:hypothetical protein
MLWKAVKEILEIAGYEIVSIEQELFQLLSAIWCSKSGSIQNLSKAQVK